MPNKLNSKGFTMVEMALVMSIMFTLMAVLIPSYMNFLRQSRVDNERDRLLSTIKIARTKTLASGEGGQWGVYFSTASTPHSYILFMGEDYINRQAAHDVVFEMPADFELKDMDLGMDQYIVFEKLTGFSNLNGSTTLAFSSYPENSAAVFVGLNGYAGIKEQAEPSESGLVKDARRVRFTYSAIVDTLNDDLHLSFDGGATIETIPFDSGMVGGVFSWGKKIDVGGEEQNIKIHTLKINDPDTVFCLHRDSGANTKSLDVALESENLLSITADGVTTTKGTSSWVDEPVLR
jgi:hypothetical protein